MAQHTMQIPVDKIAYIDENFPANSYLGQSTVKLGGVSKYNYWGYSATKHILIQYSITVPVRKKIIDCMLHLYSAGESGYDEFYVVHADTQWSNPTWDNTIFESGLDRYTYLTVPANDWAIFNLQINSYYINTLNTARLTLDNWDTQTRPNYEFNSNNAASNAPYIEYIYEDVPPSKPTTINPIGAFKDNQSTIRFEWQYNSTVGGIQKAFNLQWSTDQTNWNTISQTTPNNYYDASPNTITSGNVYWRIQTYNEYDEPSGYSDVAAFYSIGAPAIPTISNVQTDTARPVITWTATNQQVYQLQVVQGEDIIYDTNDVPVMSEMSHKVKTFLPDGAYTAKVRIQNEYSLWSDWGTLDFTISTVKPEAPSFALSAMAYGIQVVINSLPGIAYFLLYRDSICIAKILPDNLIYNDNSAACGKTYNYYVRAITAGETFNDSVQKQATVNFKHNLFALASAPSNVIVLKYNIGKIPDKSSRFNIVATVNYYNGRKYGVTEFTENQEFSMSFAFSVQDLSEIDSFVDMVSQRQTILFRDKRGRKIFGTIANFTALDTRNGYNISFAINQSDFTEEIEV